VFKVLEILEFDFMKFKLQPFCMPMSVILIINIYVYKVFW